MKRNLIYHSFIFLFCLLFSCSDENMGFSDDNTIIEEGDKYFTVTVSMGDGSSTRDDPFQFDDGLAEEYALAPNGYHYIFLYDVSGNLIDASTLSLPNDYTISDSETQNNLTTTFVSCIRVGSMKKTELSNYLSRIKEALVILNTDIDFDLSNATTKSKYTKEFLTGLTINAGSVDSDNDAGSSGRIKVNDQYYMTMTNSVYVSGSTVKYGPDVNLRYDNNVYPTKEDALKSTSNNGIVVYVERLAAKVTFHIFFKEPYTTLIINPEDGWSEVNVCKGWTLDRGYSNEDKDWEATVKGFGINGVEPEEYLLKKISASRDYFDYWSITDHFRSYWAEDAHYSIAQYLEHYPHQYRKTLETSDYRFYHAGNAYDSDNGEAIKGFTKNNDSYYLKYISFKDFLGKNGVGNEDGSRYQYTIENTYDDSNESTYLGERGYFSAGTHALIGAQLNIKDYEIGKIMFPFNIDNTQFPSYTIDGYYRDQNENFFTNKDALLYIKLKVMQEKMLPGGNSGIRVLNVDWYNHKSINSDLFKVSWAAGAKLIIKLKNGTKRELQASDLTLIPAELAGGDGQLLIAPKDKEASYYIGDQYLGLNEDDDTDPVDYNRVVSLFHKLLGPIDHYAEGYMYYAVPITHTVDKVTEGTSWSTVGNIGVVRNNHYKFIITGTTAPGTPVDQIKQPIIPMLDVKRSYLNVSTVILPWHDIPEQFPGFYPRLN